MLTAASSSDVAAGGLPAWLPAGVLAAFIGGAFLLWAGWRQRRYETRREERQAARAQREATQARLRPELRTLIEIGEQLEGVIVRMTNDPAREVQAAPESLDELRRRLNHVIEPELLERREAFHTAITDVAQWRAIRQGTDEDLAAGRRIHPQRLERLERYEDEERAQVRELIQRARAMLQEL